MEFIGLSLFLSYLIYAWFHTDVFEEYGKILKLANVSKTFKNYLKIKSEGANISFPEYLQENKDTFLVRLITCFICIPFWVLIPALPVLLIVLFSNDLWIIDKLGVIESYLAMPFIALAGYYILRILNKLK